MKLSGVCGITSPRTLRGALCLLFGVLITGTVIAAPTQPMYRIVVLPELADTEFAEATDISDAGLVVGEASEWSSDGYRYGISWGAPPYSPQRLPALSPDSLQTIVTGVNNAGFVVGGALMRDGSNAYYLAVMWRPDGAIVELGDLPRGPSFGQALDINTLGIAVGFGTVPYGQWSQHWPVFWPAPGAPRALRGVRGILNSGYAFALNDFGDIAGHYYLSDDVRHAARWPAGQRRQKQDLDDLPGGLDQSFAFGINNAGQVVGSGYSDLGLRAVLWGSDGSATDLGDVHGGSDYEAVDINDAGQVVGRYYQPGFVRQAFLWTAEHGMMDLYALIDPADPLRERFGSHAYVSAINATGLIAGATLTDQPGGLRAIVLVPVE